VPITDGGLLSLLSRCRQLEKRELKFVISVTKAGKEAASTAARSSDVMERAQYTGTPLQFHLETEKNVNTLSLPAAEHRIQCALAACRGHECVTRVVEVLLLISGLPALSQLVCISASPLR
jgi:hypothetical protein